MLIPSFLAFLTSNRLSNVAVLFLRLIIGVMMLTHGVAKLENFDHLLQTFPDPLGVGVGLSLILIIMAEVGASCFLIVGFLTRLAVIPLIFSMIVAAFFTFPEYSLGMSELPILYLSVYCTILLLGPGKCSIDYLLDRAYMQRK